jgi:hypothetical protein
MPTAGANDDVYDPFADDDDFAAPSTAPAAEAAAIQSAPSASSGPAHQLPPGGDAVDANGVAPLSFSTATGFPKLIPLPAEKKEHPKVSLVDYGSDDEDDDDKVLPILSSTSGASKPLAPHLSANAVAIEQARARAAAAKIQAHLSRHYHY